MATESKKANGEVISHTGDKKGNSKNKDVIDDSTEVETEATVTITKPKKTISTSVEIERKILPDGKVEETKTTTTNTIINGKIEDSKVQKDTRILSDEEAKAVIQEESEEEEEEEISKETLGQQNGFKEVTVTTQSEIKSLKTASAPKTFEEGKAEVKQLETKQLAQEDGTEDEQEEEEGEKLENEEVVEIIKSEKSKENPKATKEESEEEEDEEEEDEEEEDEEEEEEGKIIENKVVKIRVTEEAKEKQQVKTTTSRSEEEEDDNEDEGEKEKDETEEDETEEDNKEKYEKEEDEKVEEKLFEKTESKEQESQNEPETSAPIEKPQDTLKECTQIKLESNEQHIETHVEKNETEKENPHTKTEISETKTETITSTLIPEVHTTIKKETTELSSSASDNSCGQPMSTQTELHRIENIVTVNRTTKSLDNTYEHMTQQGAIPTVKTYFAPNREKISTSPQPAKPYTSIFTPPDRKPETRHSLLLERLSTECHFATPESYPNTYPIYSSNQNYETTTNQWNQEPQSEVVNVSNVKPSSLKTNSQWYQTPQPTQATQPVNNVIYNNVKPTTPITQPTRQQPSYDSAPYTVPLYQSEPVCAQKPSNWGYNNLGNLSRVPSINAQSNQYSFMSNKNSTESYTKQSDTQQYSSGYIPPPWESEKTAPYQSCSYYEPQPPHSAPIISPTAAPAWKPYAPQSNFQKPPPLSYHPPAPNASFVKSPSPAATAGRRTYYSEYERRYISVPESTYIPTETKMQRQWDASPQYYYDNSEPGEQTEPSWRKELREFTEKNTKEETTVVQPPWAEEVRCPKNSSAPYSAQPTWSQTLRPRSYMEQSYESESVQRQTQEWPRAQVKRPVSAFLKTNINSPIPERSRGVSVDRYNANSYESPNSYTPSINNGYSLPWETQQQVSPAPHQNSEQQQSALSSKSYHNPHVPAYHVRPTECRDYQVSYQPRWRGQSRELPVQSRSFKYLQMLTGTEDGVEAPEPFIAQQPHHAAPRPRHV